LALYRRDAVNKIRYLSGTILNHIIKIKYIDNKNEHWISEIKSYFRKIDEIEIKPFNRRFSDIEYLEFLLVEPYCSAESSAKKNIFIFRKEFIYKNILRYINSDYKVDIEYDQINFDEIVNFFKRICRALEKYDDILEIIDDEFK
jgi:hypothetical protein